MKRTTIAIDEELKNEIYKHGKMGDTPNTVLKRILEEYKQMKENNKQTIKQLKQVNKKTKPTKNKPKTKHKMDPNPSDLEREG